MGIGKVIEDEKEDFQNLLDIMEDIEFIQNIIKNPKRKKILELIRTKQLNIMELSQEINLSYRNTFRHLNMLESLGLVKLEYATLRDIQGQGHPTIIKPTSRTIYSMLREHYKKMGKYFND